VFTGSQLPLRAMRTDARSNLLNSVACAVSGRLREVALCFGHVLLRGNHALQGAQLPLRRLRLRSARPPLAWLGIDVEWNESALLAGARELSAALRTSSLVCCACRSCRACDPANAIGDLYGRGVRGLVLEAFGTGNVPSDARRWTSWLREQSEAGLEVLLLTQCRAGPLYPGLYRTGQKLLELGVRPVLRMSPECAIVKLMLCLAHPGLDPCVPLAGECEGPQ
jgi:L-asparaginase